MNWAFSDPLFKEALHAGAVQVDQQKLVKSYREWVKDERWLNFHNTETDQVLKVMSPKRGNIAYANRQKRKFKKIIDAMEGKTWDVPSTLPGARATDRDTHVLLLTLTFAHEQYSTQEAWRLCTSRGQALNKFSARLFKVLGSKATVKVKEGSGSGYPAPHIIVAVDRPIQSFRYRNKWRIRSQETLRQLKAAWPHGHLDCQAIVGGEKGAQGAMCYVTKYLQKVAKVQPMDTVQPTMAELTHSWNKLFGCRDVVSKHFIQRLDLNASSIEGLEDESPWEFLGLTDEGPAQTAKAELRQMFERWQSRPPKLGAS